MSQQNYLNEKFRELLNNKLDKEDVIYLQKSLVALTTENEMFNNISKNDWLEMLSSCCKTEPNNWFDKISYLMNSIEPSSSESSTSDCQSLCSSTSKYFNPSDLYFGNGIDDEDINFLKRSFNIFLWDIKEPWTTKVFWDSHPPTADNETVQLPTSGNCSSPLTTGCARSEGYFKVNKLSERELKRNRKQVIPLETNYKMSTAPYKKTYKVNKQPVSRDARNNQRRLFTAYQTITHSDLFKLNELKFRKKKLRLGKSEIHGLGLFAVENIPPNEIIIEYVGQIIRPIIADIREKQYKTSGIGSYCFRVDDDTIIDATKHGNLNRYINHSCNPNSYAKILNFDSQKKIVIFSKKSIKVDEEITYDYKMPFEDDKVKCLCRAAGCRKSLN